MGEISIKVSEDQNTITLDDGAVFVAVDAIHEDDCKGCDIPGTGACHITPCTSYYRKDSKTKIFIKEPAND